MQVRKSVRRRAMIATAAGLMVAGAAFAQVGILPPPSRVPPLPEPTPLPVIAAANESPVIMVGLSLPPLVVTPPVAPTAKSAETVVPAIPAVRITPLPTPSEASEVVASPPPIVVPRMTEVPNLYPPPPVEVPGPVVVKSAKPAFSEIVTVGPKTVDAAASFSTALIDAKAALAKLRDYSGHIIHQERTKAGLSSEFTAEIRVRATPRSIAMRYIAPSNQVGREIVLTDTPRGQVVRVKAAGTYGPLAFATVSVSDPKAAVDSRHTLADTGIAAIVERLEKVISLEAKLKNPIGITAGDFTFAKKTVIRYEITCERPHAMRDAAKFVVCIDPDTHLPVRFEAYDRELREVISFVNLSFNTGLSDVSFGK
jgi:hypothetical protein